MKSRLINNHIIYKTLLLMVFMLNTVTYLHEIMSPFYKLFLICGAAIFVWDIIRGKKVWKDRSLWALLAFAAVYLVSILINGGEGLSRNLKELVYMLLFILTLYAGDRDKADADYELSVLGRVMFVLCAALSLACLLTYFFAESRTYVTSDGLTGYIGSFEGRMCGLVYMNTGGAIYALLMTISIIFLRFRKLGLAEKILCYLGLVLGLICSVLAFSRTAILAFMLTLIAAFIWLFPMRSEKANVSRGCKVFRLLALIALAGGLIFAGLLVLTGSELLWKLNGPLSGRVVLWTEGLALLKEKLLFGVTAANYIAQADVTSFTGWQAGGIHSLYMAVPVYSGLLGCLTLSAFTAINLRRARGCIARPDKGFAAAAIIILLGLFMELAEVRTIFMTNIFSVVFWIALGNMNCRLAGK